MKLSTKGRYGIRALEVLVDHYGRGPVSIREIAEKQNISIPYLEQLFTKLRTANLVESKRGAYGGYVLSRAPKDISVGEVLVALEGDIKFDCCSDEDEPTCHETAPCRTHDVLGQIEQNILNYTYGLTLAEL